MQHCQISRRAHESPQGASEVSPGLDEDVRSERPPIRGFAFGRVTRLRRQTLAATHRPAHPLDRAATCRPSL